ncbi:hypothetical protein TorRG33x02_197690 [Trema orientale]|uniref:RNase H type-1 domain-containing protein n=1 Tax=Trema orientale TaxID=63057 RepID=A0A2P5EFZ4_TREOI|nr:hypothetical protein TorRG33x02_197690 [Trema orientale]
MVLATRSKCFTFTEPTNAETSALLLGGVELARENAWQFVIFERDCKVLVQSWNKEGDPPWTISPLLNRAWTFVSSFTDVIVVFVKRECNFFAHNVAAWTLVCNVFDNINISLSLLPFVRTTTPGGEVRVLLFWWLRPFVGL